VSGDRGNYRETSEHGKRGTDSSSSSGSHDSISQCRNRYEGEEITSRRKEDMWKRHRGPEQSVIERLSNVDVEGCPGENSASSCRGV
jgi:hypothetical protein